ncbi:DUF6545 domain-containing protein [Gordonia sp. SCSIO 19800]|uniref:DUF6545 domain-containing protein n=1 Tax=Gordonia sp. SCSIO 19800 TaxID=2826926 RepID=UPI001B80EF74|nr:DUF6545 domain-containing protein [Gordonia sp. SCSIO 19800]MBR7194636.1 hypothetical protein [Gordonia sp. SCSIO 19800]
MRPSDVLVQQTTTAVPTWICGPVIAIALALIGYRMLILRDRRPTTTAAHWYALFIVVYAGLRVPGVQDWMMGHTPLTLADLRVIGAILQVAAAAALLLLGLRWRSRSGTTSSAVWWAVTTGVLAAAVLLVWVHAPLRANQMAIEELDGSWRTGLYLTLHSILFIPAELVVIATLWQMAKTGTRSRRILVLALSAAIAFSIINLMWVMGAGWLMSAGVDGSWTQPRSSARNDFALYPTLLPWLPVGIPAVVVDIRRRLGLDHAREQRMAELRPMWESLTAALPAYRLAELGPADGFPSETEREHRMRIELEDTIYALSRNLPEGTAWPESAAGRAQLLREALHAWEAGRRAAVPPASTGETRPLWASSEADLDAVAREWRSTPTCQQTPERQTTASARAI